MGFKPAPQNGPKWSKMVQNLGPWNNWAMSALTILPRHEYLRRKKVIQGDFKIDR